MHLAGSGGGVGFLGVVCGAGPAMAAARAAFSASTASDASSSNSVPFELTGDGPTMSDGLSSGMGQGVGVWKPAARATPRRWCRSGERDVSASRGPDRRLSGDMVLAAKEETETGLSAAIVVVDDMGASRAMVGIVLWV